MKLEELVYSFRRAIESAKDNNESGEFFRKFPLGQCGNTSDILAQYLIDNGIKNIEYVNGTYYGEDFEDRCSHTWLYINNSVIDITADQFKYEHSPIRCDVPVYIGPMSAYYRQFEVTPGGRYKHHGLHSEWIHYSDLKAWYETILKYL